MRLPDGTLAHFKTPDGAPQSGPLLTDSAALIEANLDAHAAGGEARFLERAIRLADDSLARRRAPDGAFLDRPAGLEAIGNLRIPFTPVDENGRLADGLLRLAALLHEERYAAAARETLAALRVTAERSGSHAAPFARALTRTLGDPFTITVVGAPAASVALREAALRLPEPLVDVRTIAPDDAATLERTGFLVNERPLAYPCIGMRCGAPAESATQLAESADALRQLPAR